MQGRAGGLGGGTIFQVLSTLTIEGGSSTELFPEQDSEFVVVYSKVNIIRWQSLMKLWWSGKRNLWVCRKRKFLIL